MNHPHVRNIALDIILTLLTCMLYNIYIQYKQIEAVNDMLKERKYDFVFWFLLSVITCGLYHIYHEYRKSTDIARVLNKDSGSAGLVALLLSLFSLSFINDAIQQSEINTYYGNNAL